jgi:hypothetical protein
MQTLFVDNKDGAGFRDFTKFFESPTQFFTHPKNTPAIFEFTVVEVSGVPGWVVPDRGAYVRFEDNRWISRDPGVSDGVVFTGYVVSPPNPVILGMANGDQTVAYHLQVASDDWLANTHTLPAKTYIDKTHGFILKDLLQDIFANVDVFPFDVSGIADGGTERIYQVDPTKKWTEIAAAFGAVDGFVYRALDHRLSYRPEIQFASTDPSMGITVDERDVRFDPANLSLARVAASLVNDVTVFGSVEPTNIVRESYVSDGYQGSFPLSDIPYGVDELNLLDDDFTAGSIDETRWQHADSSINVIQTFQGSLNIIGGPGADTGSVYLRSRKGVELSGFIYTRDGEIFFPPGATGSGVIGGLYTDDAMREASCWSGWYVDLNARTIYPISGDGRESSHALSINLNHHYVLRRQIEVDSTFRALNQYVVKTSFGQYVVGGDAPAAGAWVTWLIEEVNADDPNAIVTTSTQLLRKRLEAVPPYALYAPIVPYDCHLVMNYVQVYKPQQIGVSVNDVPVQIGSYLDGGKCQITVDGNHGALNWYGVNRGTTTTDGNTENVTIPPQRAIVKIWYYQSGQAVARLISQDSILREKQRFNDDGVRQITLHASDGKPTPRNSEECLFLAEAYLSDRIEARYEGTYRFSTGENDVTNLMIWPCPGDQVPSLALQRDGTYVDVMLDITRVTSRFMGGGAYQFDLELGPLNRFDAVERQLYLQHATSLDTDLPLIADIDPENIEVLKTTGDTRPDDPLNFATSDVTSSSFVLSIGTSKPADVVAYEVRADDTGWGHGGHIQQATTNTFTLPRARRDVTYFVRPYNALGQYSRRSARVRLVYPLANNIAISGVDGEITPDTLTLNIPLPIDPDFAGVRVLENGPGGTLFYDGDGITTNASVADVNALAGSGTLTIEIPNATQARAFTVYIQSYNLIGEYGPGFPFTITKFVPGITIPPAPLPSNPDVWTWQGENANTYQITTFAPSGAVDDSWKVPANITDWNFGNRQDTDTTIEIAPVDDWGFGTPRIGSNGGDIDLPSAPNLSVSVGPPDDPNVQTRQVFKLTWTTPTQNERGITNYIIDVCNEPTFSSEVEEYTYPPQLNKADFFYPGTRRYFRVSAANAFGQGPWSNLALADAPDPLDPLGQGGAYDYNTPVFDPFIGTGGINGAPTILGWQINNGASRSNFGLTSDGSVGLNLPFNVQQFNGTGSAEGLIRADMSVNSLLDGGVVTDGSNRARSGLNSFGSLTTNIPFGLGMFDGGGILRSMILNSMNVAALADGGNISTGGLRALAAISASNLLIASLAFGVSMFDGGGILRSVMNGGNSVTDLQNGTTALNGANRALAAIGSNNFLASGINFGVLYGGFQPYAIGFHSLDNIGDGGTYARTQYFQRDGGTRAFNALDANFLLISGLLGHNVFYSSAQMQEGIRAGRFAIQPLGGFGDAGSFRIWDDQVDQFSIIQDGVAGANIYGAYRAANSFSGGGGGFNRDFRI